MGDSEGPTTSTANRAAVAPRAQQSARRSARRRRDPPLVPKMGDRWGRPSPCRLSVLRARGDRRSPAEEPPVSGVGAEGEVGETGRNRCEEDSPSVPRSSRPRAPRPARVARERRVSLSLRDMTCDILDQPSPLGLRLKKSPSLVDLIQMTLSQATSSAGLFVVDSSGSEAPTKKEVKPAALTTGERLKASNFPADFLKIGTWEYISRYEGDLVAKFYFAKRKLVWEVLDDGLKSKIEIQWSDITALKVICQENEQGTLDLVLARPPVFFKEIDPQPRKHTLWHTASDFTNGQASLIMRHTLKCPSPLLSKNIEKLIQCDRRLYELSKQQNVIPRAPYFKRSIFENPNESKDCHSFNDFKYEREMSLHTDPISPCASSSSNEVVQLEFPVQPVSIGSCATDFQTSVVIQEPKNSNWRNQLKKPGTIASISVNDFVNRVGNCKAEQSTMGNPPLANNEQSREVLEDLAQCLFSETQFLPTSDKHLMARVNSFYSLIENNSVPSTMTKPEGKVNSNIGVIELDSDCSDGEELKSSAARKPAGETESPTISRKDSYGDLLLNLPRIASVPQFLFDIQEDFGK